MKRLLAIAVFALIFITTSAQAADKKWYVSGDLGFSMASDSDLSILGVDFAEVTFDPGFNIAGALGYDYGSIRAEFELAYHAWGLDEATIPGIIAGVPIPGCPCSGPIEGDVGIFSYMVNGYYDFQIGDSSIVPYLGGGFGGAYVKGDLGLGDSDYDAVFAYQLMAGIGYEINSLTILTLGYRYFATTDPGFDLGIGADLEATVESHDFNLGVRLMF